ncbi:MAG: hypothetical protein WAW71_01995, partial [Propioniciclava sp.]
MNGPWHQALGLALTGEDLALGVQERFEVNEAVAALASVDWDAARIAEHAHRLVGQAPWPHPVPAAQRGPIGAAEFHAALLRLRERLGLSALEVRPPST